MRIKVKQGTDFNLNLIFPTGLVMNRVAAYFLFPSIAKQNGVTITRKQAVAFVKAIKDYKRTHPDWKIVEVESANGEIVEIKL